MLSVIAATVLAGCWTTPLWGNLPVSRAAIMPLDHAFASRTLLAHNLERAAVGTPPLVWDPDLASAAQEYAEGLATSGVLQHSPRNTRPGQRENLWMGPKGLYDQEAMVGSWASEKSMFQAGAFPNVSRTANWADVAHYTQMIWRDTRRMGCGLGSSAGFDFLVCRYSPAGNIDGRTVP